MALLRDQAQEVAAPRNFVGAYNMPTREVAAPDIDDLAFLYQLFHGLPDLFPWRGAVNVMHLVQVDMIGLQPAQAFVARPPDMVGRQAAVEPRR